MVGPGADFAVVDDPWQSSRSPSQGQRASFLFRPRLTDGATGPAQRLEAGAAAKLELLYDVVFTLGNRDCVVEAERAERRLPDQADTDRRAHNVTRIILQAQTGAWRGGVSRTVVGWRNTAGQIDFTRGSPISRPLVVAQPASIRIHGTLQANFLWQEPERHLKFQRSAPILRTTERILGTERIDITWTDTVRRKTAYQVRTLLELIQHPDRVVADLGHHAALEVKDAHDIGHQRRVVFHVERRLQVDHIAADACEVLFPVDQETVGRVLVVIQRVVIEGIADRRRNR